jgi:hypothetical protein
VLSANAGFGGQVARDVSFIRLFDDDRIIALRQVFVKGHIGVQTPQVPGAGSEAKAVRQLSL